MSDTDTSLSDALPSESEIDKGLREAVRAAFKRGEGDSITLRTIRTTVESTIGLHQDFFKHDLKWKDRSKTIVQDEVDAHNDDNAPSPNPTTRKPYHKQNKVRSSAGKADTKGQSKKRKYESPPQSKPKKKRKSTSEASDEDDTDDGAQSAASEVFQEPHKSEQTLNARRSREDGSKPNREEDGASESEMSVVLDEGPKPKRTKRSNSDGKPKPKSAESGKAKKAADNPADPDAEEIKRLQGWLVKCGIRKMWYKELAPYDTRKAKIKHLREMLADAGMTGRYSKEKADQIRDQRELQADLEAVQEGEKTWGKPHSENEKSDADEKPPRRRLARGLQGLDFLNESDGEETD